MSVLLFIVLSTNSSNFNCSSSSFCLFEVFVYRSIGLPTIFSPLISLPLSYALFRCLSVYCVLCTIKYIFQGIKRQQINYKSSYKTTSATVICPFSSCFWMVNEKDWKSRKMVTSTLDTMLLQSNTSFYLHIHTYMHIITLLIWIHEHTFIHLHIAPKYMQHKHVET